MSWTDVKTDLWNLLFVFVMPCWRALLLAPLLLSGAFPQFLVAHIILVLLSKDNVECNSMSMKELFVIWLLLWVFLFDFEDLFWKCSSIFFASGLDEPDLKVKYILRIAWFNYYILKVSQLYRITYRLLRKAHFSFCMSFSNLFFVCYNRLKAYDFIIKSNDQISLHDEILW